MFKIRGKCAGLRAKTVNVSGHLPIIVTTDPRSHAAGWPAFVMPLLMSQIAAHAPDGDITIRIDTLVHLSLATMVRS